MADKATLPRWIEVLITCSIFVLIDAFFLFGMYYFGAKFSIFTAFIILLGGLFMFAIGMSTAKKK
jgi:hypothetical protein